MAAGASGVSGGGVGQPVPVEPVLVSHRERLSNQLDNMRKNNVMCDVTLVCDSTEFTAHKVVLSACSAFLHNQFTDNDDLARLTIPEIEPDIMEVILSFVYTGHVNTVSDANVQQVLAAAHHLRTTHLYHYCRERLVSRMNMANLEQVWDVADLYADPFLQSQAAQFAARNFRRITRNATVFVELPAERLIALVGSDRLTVANYDDVLIAVLRWVNHDRQRRIRILPDIIPHIKFDQLTPQYVTSLNGDATVMDSLDLLQSLTRTMASRYQRSTGMPPPGMQLSKSAFANGFGGNGDGGGGSDSKYSTTSLPTTGPRMAGSLPFPVSTGGGGGGRLLGNGNSNGFGGSGGGGGGSGSLLESTREFGLPPLGLSGGATGEPVLVVLGQDKDDSVILQHFALYSRQWGNPYRAPVQKKFASIVAHKGLLYLLGGKVALKPSATVHICDVRSRKTRIIADMSQPRCGMGVAELDGLVYVVGGYNKSGWLHEVECYDSVSGTWDQAAPLHEGKEGVGVVAANGRLYAIGGVPVPTTEVYDPTSNQWTRLVRMRHARVYHGISVLEGLVYVVGGFGHHPDRVQCFDLDTGNWNVLTSRAPQQCRDTWCAAVPWNDRVLLINSEGLLWEFDAAHETWAKLPSSYSLVGGYVSGFISATVLDVSYR